MTLTFPSAFAGELVTVADRLESCEAVIKQSFVDCGLALRTIREERLYRETHSSFEAYCAERWDMVASRARQLIIAAETVTNVTALGAPAPKTESQARELSGLKPEAAAEVLREATERTNGKPTAKAIREARAEKVGDRPASKVTDTVHKDQRRQVSDGLTPESTAIAPAVGVSTGQAHADIHAARVQPAEHLAEPESSKTDPAYPQARRASWPERKDAPAVKGLDGKTYARPEPKPAPAAPEPKAQQEPKRNRRPLRDGFRDASLDLDKLVRRFQNLVSDDRFPRNKDEVARYRNDLIRANEAFQRLIEKF